MSISPFNLAYTIAGGLLLYSGFKGATVSDVIKAAYSGNLSDVTDTEPIGNSSSSAASGQSATGVTAGSSEENYLTIANYLVANGYSKAAAAGICGCISGESSGNPLSVEDSSNPGSGGIGLIQWTPGSSYPDVLSSVQSGNATEAMQVQLPAIISYNNSQGAGLVQMLNAQTSAVAAADFYSQYFERPAITGSDVNTTVANYVYSQLTAPAASSATGATRVTTA